MSAAGDAAVPVWRFYRVEVARTRRLSPSFVRVTFTGADLDEHADNGYDQRVKLLLPAPDGGFAHLPQGDGWYAALRRLPEQRRPPVRTYTVRGVRPERREVDLDMVLHGDTGPASRFAARATVGDEAILLGPNRRYPGRHGGLEFRPPTGHLGPTLIAGDETALPAVISILERLPDDAHGEVVLEVPDPGDVADPRVPAGVRVTWVVRGRDESGLSSAVRDAARRLGLGARPGPDAAPAVEKPGAMHDEAPLWDVPEQAVSSGGYAWLAGEASVITGLRRYLVRNLGVDRRGVAFMGYWKRGRAEC
jgi:NADPH-dependent ferric siderophore reductase